MPRYAYGLCPHRLSIFFLSILREVCIYTMDVLSERSQVSETLLGNGINKELLVI